MQKYDVAAYVWPAYTGDEPRAKMFWQEGIGEWQTVKTASPKFDGHNWPRKPLWGYVNEADPNVMQMEIDEAVRHGVNVFIYDWYWFDRRPFLENCLNNGFLGSPNNKNMKFYLMWANHDANHLWNKALSDSDVGKTVIWQGGIEREAFEKMCDRIIDKYFRLDNYYRIGDCPVFMIYELSTLINGLSSIENTKSALAWFRQRVVEKGFKGVHIQITVRDGISDLSGIDSSEAIDFSSVIDTLNINSVTHYQFCHITDINRDYRDVLEDVKEIWENAENTYKVPYYAHVSVGWDNNPRFRELHPRILKNNTPENFEIALRAAKEYTDRILEKAPDRPSLITVNSWNEWTEGSYLEPDDTYGYGYLDAIKRVFANE